METLEKLIYDLYKKNARQCTDEEIYNALLIYTKNQLFERGYQDGKKKIYYISAEFLIGKLLSNNLINLGIYDDVAKFLKENGIRTRERTSGEGDDGIFDSMRKGYVTYVINTKDINAKTHETDGYQLRRCAVENNITMFTALDTVRVFLDVLEEVTITISTIDN